jgi:hypothetical protein
MYAYIIFVSSQAVNQKCILTDFESLRKFDFEAICEYAFVLTYSTNAYSHIAYLNVINL